MQSKKRTDGFSNRAERRKHLKKTGEHIISKNRPFINKEKKPKYKSPFNHENN